MKQAADNCTTPNLYWRFLSTWLTVVSLECFGAIIGVNFEGIAVLLEPGDHR